MASECSQVGCYQNCYHQQSVASEALTQSCQVGKSHSTIGLDVLLVHLDAERHADANLHFSGFLAPATGAAEGVHQPVGEEAPPDVILVANLCAQTSSIHCTGHKHWLIGRCVKCVVCHGIAHVLSNNNKG